MKHAGLNASGWWSTPKAGTGVCTIGFLLWIACVASAIKRETNFGKSDSGEFLRSLLR